MKNIFSIPYLGYGVVLSLLIYACILIGWPGPVIITNDNAENRKEPIFCKHKGLPESIFFDFHENKCQQEFVSDAATESLVGSDLNSSVIVENGVIHDISTSQRSEYSSSRLDAFEVLSNEMDLALFERELSLADYSSLKILLQKQESEWPSDTDTVIK